MVLKNPHHWNRRKFETYRLLDSLDSSRPIIVLPAVGANLSMLSLDAVKRMQRELDEEFQKHVGKRKIELPPDPQLIELETFFRSKGIVPLEELLTTGSDENG